MANLANNNYSQAFEQDYDHVSYIGDSRAPSIASTMTTAIPASQYGDANSIYNDGTNMGGVNAQMLNSINPYRSLSSNNNMNAPSSGMGANMGNMRNMGNVGNIPNDGGNLSNTGSFGMSAPHDGSLEYSSNADVSGTTGADVKLLEYERDHSTYGESLRRRVSYRARQAWLYNAPHVVDILNQPKRFFLVAAATYRSGPGLVDLLTRQHRDGDARLQRVQRSSSGSASSASSGTSASTVSGVEYSFIEYYLTKPLYSALSGVHALLPSWMKNLNKNEAIRRVGGERIKLGQVLDELFVCEFPSKWQEKHWKQVSCVMGVGAVFVTGIYTYIYLKRANSRFDAESSHLTYETNDLLDTILSKLLDVPRLEDNYVRTAVVAGGTTKSLNDRKGSISDDGGNELMTYEDLENRKFMNGRSLTLTNDVINEFLTYCKYNSVNGMGGEFNAKGSVAVSLNLPFNNLSVIEFTCANCGWYCTDLKRVAIKRKQNRYVAAFITNARRYNGSVEPSESTNVASNDAPNQAMIVYTAESIVHSMLNRVYMPVMDRPDIDEISKCCKVIANDLQQKFRGHWAVMIGHRALHRKWTNVDFEFGQNMRQHANGTNLFEYRIDDATDSMFGYVGRGPKALGWTLVVLSLE